MTANAPKSLTVSMDPAEVISDGQVLPAGAEVTVSREVLLHISLGMFKRGLHTGASMALQSRTMLEQVSNPTNAKVSRIVRDAQGRIEALVTEQPDPLQARSRSRTPRRPSPQSELVHNLGELDRLAQRLGQLEAQRATRPDPFTSSPPVTAGAESLSGGRRLPAASIYLRSGK